jgi:hypothetical protein
VEEVIMSIGTQRLPLIDADMKVWVNNSSAMPEWVKGHMLGPIESNGTFLVRTSVGQTRVHHGHAVIEHRGVAYTCETQDDLVSRLHTEGATKSDIAVGPGKRLDRSGAGPIKRHKPARSRERKIAYPSPVGVMPISSGFMSSVCQSMQAINGQSTMKRHDD